jgi:diadenosine tetraphosphate (Ap4A) HIT family hydrolase
MPWPTNWDALYSGMECPLCEQERPEETPLGIRVHAGTLSDAYLSKHAAQRGYVVVIWRGSHVAEPTDLSAEDANSYWQDVLRVARAVRHHFHPRKVNYETLGNGVPHLHTHVTARYAENDVNPGAPLPFPRGDALPADELARDVTALRDLLR